MRVCICLGRPLASITPLGHQAGACPACLPLIATPGHHPTTTTTLQPLSHENFEATLARYPIAVINFYAPWCAAAARACAPRSLLCPGAGSGGQKRARGEGGGICGQAPGPGHRHQRVPTGLGMHAIT